VNAAVTTEPLEDETPAEFAEFDEYARTYQEMLVKSISASGSPPEYFSEYKAKYLRRLLGKAFDAPLLDFGCGIGNLITFLADAFPVVHGYDPSVESVKLAKKRAPAATFFHKAADVPRGHYGAAVLANVLHHVPVAERPSVMRTVVSTLAPGGRVVIFEHNRLNPVTRHAVEICPFDKDAILLYPREVKRLLVDAELAGVTLEYIVFFPGVLRTLRPLEPKLGWLPLGAQVCAWGTKA
jgi:SAM-dependent methyltransferase